MKNSFHRKKWNASVVQQHMYPPPVPLIKNKHDDNLEKYSIKLKLHRDLTSEKLDLYEFKIVLFENGDP